VLFLGCKFWTGNARKINQTL